MDTFRTTDGQQTDTFKKLRSKEDTLSAKAEIINKKKDMREYNENQHTGDDLPDLDLDTGEISSSKGKANKSARKNTPEVLEVFDVFDDNPARATWKLREIERESAKVLYATYGIKELTKRYSIVKKHRDEPMCPQINKPSDFLDKMPNMENFLKTI